MQSYQILYEMECLIPSSERTGASHCQVRFSYLSEVTLPWAETTCSVKSCEFLQHAHTMIKLRHSFAQLGITASSYIGLKLWEIENYQLHV